MSDPVPPEPSPDSIADLPLNDQIPPPKPSSSPPQPRPVPLRVLLAAVPSNVDAFLAHLNRCLSTPTGIDTVLLFICYTSRLGAAVLGSLSRRALLRSAREWIALAASLPPRMTLVVEGKGIAAPTTLVLAQRLKALSTLLSEARMILRLWGLLGMYFWARGMVQKTLRSARATRACGEKVEGDAAAPEGERRLGLAIGWTQLLLCVGLQTLENGAYLSGKGVLGWTPKTQGMAYKWSARLWAGYVGIELGRLVGEALGGSIATRSEQDQVDWTDKWRRQVARNLAWFPLTLHWSMDKGFISEALIGMFGSIPGIIQMQGLWKETA